MAPIGATAQCERLPRLTIMAFSERACAPSLARVVAALLSIDDHRKGINDRCGEIAAELAKLGFLNERGVVFSAASAASMLA
jgi:hypothetical protein